MKTAIEILAAIGMVVGMYGLILCGAAAKRTLVPPGGEIDERGEYGRESKRTDQ